MKLAVRVDRPWGPDFRLSAAFDVECSVLAVVGDSGAGKSCLLEVLAGAVRDGEVTLDGMRLSDLPLHERRVGWVTQEPALFPHMDVAANLAFSPRARGVDEIAAALDIAHLLSRRPAHLSGGERRRVALARALASDPRLLLLDEPFNGLDERRRRAALSLLTRVATSFGVPMVLVSHVAEEVIGLADHALRLDGGRLVAQGRPTEVLRAGETAVDNHLVGEVVAPGRVVVGGVEWHLPLPAEAEGTVALAVFAHDVLLARERPVALSARNVWPSKVTSIEPAGGALLVRTGPPELVATLTQDAVDELALAPGVDVHVVLKATSVVCHGRA
jgi:molybdate transport system ATP-binding protein